MYESPFLRDLKVSQLHFEARKWNQITKSVIKWSESNFCLVGILKNHRCSGQCVTKPYFYMPHGPVYMLTFDCSTTIYYYYYKPQISGGKTTFHSTAGWRGHAPGVENGPFILCVCCCPMPNFSCSVYKIRNVSYIFKETHLGLTLQ